MKTRPDAPPTARTRMNTSSKGVTAYVVRKNNPEGTSSPRITVAAGLRNQRPCPLLCLAPRGERPTFVREWRVGTKFPDFSCAAECAAPQTIAPNKVLRPNPPPIWEEGTRRRRGNQTGAP